VLAVLPEGPESKIPGTVRTRVFPTRTLKGMVFIWMGEGDPASVEEDVPPEFFDNYTHILFGTEVWPVNWRQSPENAFDAHVPYVHRDSMRGFMFPFSASGPRGSRSKTINGRTVTLADDRVYGRYTRGRRPWQLLYPQLNAQWPKHDWRRLWTWAFRPANLRRSRMPVWENPEEWKPGYHLPAMVRNDHKTDMYTRNTVPIDMDRSRIIYYKAVRPKSTVGWLYEKIHWHVWGRWFQVNNFSVQDFRAMAEQDYRTPEILSATDAVVINLRRLYLRGRGMDRQTSEAPSLTSAERFAEERQQELAATTGRGGS
jgi:phenylpropionate dioxygenase-like ring-hydroxylating dioxygenase large terminal subunit